MKTPGALTEPGFCASLLNDILTRVLVVDHMNRAESSSRVLDRKIGRLEVVVGCGKIQDTKYAGSSPYV